MIFSIYFICMYSAFSAISVLLGVYLLRYADPTDFEMGLVFMIQPATALARPLISAVADRHQSHKRLLAVFSLVQGLAYVPYIVLPFLLERSRAHYEEQLFTKRTCFWIFTLCHVVGTFCNAGTRALGDALAVNFAKSVGVDFGDYKKWSPLSAGFFNPLIGLVNVGWLLPDYVPAVLCHSSSMVLLALFVWLWPNEYFLIVSPDDHDGSHHHNQQQQVHVPEGRELWARIKAKLGDTLLCRRAAEPATELSQPVGAQKAPNQPRPPATIAALAHQRAAHLDLDDGFESAALKLSARQQLRIFALLMRRDPRIPLFLLLIVFCGAVGYAPMNFVYVYMDVRCKLLGTCQASKLAGAVMLAYCVVETGWYFVIRWLRPRVSSLNLLQITLASVAFHYLFYGLVLDHVSPLFFFVEILHGIEFSTSIVSAIELGYQFANEVELLLPELIERGIITKQHDQRLVKVALNATMSSCFTLVYDGLGSVLGSFLIGLLIDHYSYHAAWIVLGTGALAGLVATLAGDLVCRLFGLSIGLDQRRHSKHTRV